MGVAFNPSISINRVLGTHPCGEHGTKIGLSSKEFCVVSSWALVVWSSGLDDSLKPFVVPACFEDENDDHDVHDTKSYKDESKYLTTSESSDETFVDTSAA